MAAHDQDERSIAIPPETSSNAIPCCCSVEGSGEYMQSESSTQNEKEQKRKEAATPREHGVPLGLNVATRANHGLSPNSVLDLSVVIVLCTHVQSCCCKLSRSTNRACHQPRREIPRGFSSKGRSLPVLLLPALPPRRPSSTLWRPISLMSNKSSSSASLSPRPTL